LAQASRQQSEHRARIALASSFRYNLTHLEVHDGHAAGNGGTVQIFFSLSG
jgi:hypothetical protein